MADSFKELFQIVFDTAGDEGVAKLAATLRSLADTGADADPKLAALATQLDRIGEAQEASKNLIATRIALSQTTDELEKATAKLPELYAQFGTTGASAETMGKAFDRAQTNIEQLTLKQAAQRLELQKAEGIFAKNGLETNNLAAANAELGKRATEAANAAQVLVPALNKTGEGAKETAAGFGEVVEKSSLLRKAVETVRDVLVTIAGFVALEKVADGIKEVVAEGDKIERLGAQFANAFGGVKEGAEALERVDEIGDSVALSLDDVQASAIRAKKQGLDPLDGTLKGLIQSNAKFGGDVQSLNGLIDLFGKATAKGELSLKDLLSLQEQGIPAAKLLGQAMGKTSDEILALAKSGQLGRSSIGLLTDALAKAGAEDASNQLSLVSTLVVKIKDQWQDFLGTIAQSGAYDFVVGKLKAINLAIKAGIADGSLKATAQSISNTIVSIGNAAAGATRFVIDHAEAIGTAVKAYLVFKSTLLAIDLATAAAKMFDFGAAVSTAGKAAEDAASESGGLGKLGARIKALPKAIQIAVAVEAVDFALTNIEALITKGNEFYALQDQLKQQDVDIAAQRAALAAKAAPIAAQLKAFADTQIASAAQLETQSQAQSQAYIEQLQNAIRYYNALRIQQQQSGDTAGADATTERLKALGVAVGEAQQHLKDLTASLTNSGAAVREVVDRFDELRTKGVSSADAVASAFDGIEIRTPEGFQQTLDIVKQISVRSRDAKDAVQSELVVALGKLNASDLREFKEKVTARLQEAKGSADALKTSLGAAIQVAFEKLGLSAEQAGQKISSSGKDIISSFDLIATSAGASADKVQLAFAAALSQASTTGEVQALERRLQELFDTGKIGADQFGVAMAAAGRKTAEIQAAATVASASLDGVGKAGETAAARISGALQDARDDLIVQENQLSAQLTAALAAHDDELAASLNARIKEVSSQIDTLNTKIGEIASPEIKAPNFKPVTDGLGSVAQAQHAVIDTSDTASRAIADMAKETGDSLNGVTADLSNFSDNARQQFAEAQDAALQFGISNEAGLRQYVIAVDQAYGKIQTEIALQKQGAEALQESWANLSDEQLRAAAGTSDGLSELSAELETVAANARAGAGQFSLLNSADLSQIEQAASSVAQRVQQISQQAESAKASLADMANSFQQQIDQINGNLADAEDLQFQNQLDQLKQQAEQAGVLNSQEYNDAVARATELHNLKLQQIAEEAAAKQKADAATQASSAAASSAGSGGGGDALPAGGDASNSKTINLTLSGKDLGVIDPNNQAQLNALVQKLIPVILQQIKTAARATGAFGG